MVIKKIKQKRNVFLDNFCLFVIVVTIVTVVTVVTVVTKVALVTVKTLVTVVTLMTLVTVVTEVTKELFVTKKAREKKCDKFQKLKLGHISKTEIVTTIKKKFNSDQT